MEKSHIDAKTWLGKLKESTDKNIRNGGKSGGRILFVTELYSLFMADIANSNKKQA